MKLRFSIRDLLWLTLVVALCVGWMIDRRRYGDPAIEFDKFFGQHGEVEFLHNRRTNERWVKEGYDWINLDRKELPKEPPQELQLDLE